MRGRDLAIVIAVVVLVILVLGVLGGGMMMGPGLMGWYAPDALNGFGGWRIVMGIAMALFWVLIIGGAIWLVVSLVDQGKPGGQARGGRALDILRERYARGEITREQFDQMRRDIAE